MPKASKTAIHSLYKFPIAVSDLQLSGLGTKISLAAPFIGIEPA